MCVEDGHANLQRTQISDSQARHILRLQRAVKFAAFAVLQHGDLTTQHFLPHAGRAGHQG